MRILQIMPDLELAGAQTMLENLTMELNKNPDNNIQIIVFYNNETAISDRLKKNNIKINYLNKKKGFDISIFFKIAKIIKKFNPDVIHTHRYTLAYVSIALKMVMKSKSIKIVHTVHNVAEKEVPKKIQTIYKKLFIKQNIIPVAISEKVKSSMIKLYKLEEKNIPIVYNGIDLNKCIKKVEYKSNNKILHVGRFSEQKNHLEIIDIFYNTLKKNQSLNLYLVGTGELLGEIKQKVKDLKIEDKVTFLGSVESSFKIMSESDIFILPSKWEGMPMTLIEAMATGLPCIAYPVGGISDMIGDNIDGFLPSNSKEFEEDILKLVEDTALRERIGKAAISKSKIYSAERMAEKYYELYNSI